MSFVDYCFSVLRTQEFVQLNCYVTSTGTLSIFFSSMSRTLGILLTLFINSNRTVSSPIRSVIIRVINKIGQARSGSLIC